LWAQEVERYASVAPPKWLDAYMRDPAKWYAQANNPDPKNLIIFQVRVTDVNDAVKPKAEAEKYSLNTCQ
jgi:hypothetical protein